MKTLPLPEIIARLCALNACNEPLAQAFVTEFSALVTAALTESGTLHVKGLGTFRKIELGDEVTVGFAPDAALAGAVNAPFSMFEPIELDDTVTDELLESADTVPAQYETAGGLLEDDAIITQTESLEVILPPGIPPVPTNQAPVHGSPLETPTNEETTTGAESETIPGNTESEIQETVHQQTLESTPTPTASGSGKQEEPHVTHEKIIEKERVVEVEGRSRHSMHLAITALAALVAGLLIGYFASDILNLSNVKSVNISADDVQVYHQSQSATGAVTPIEEAMDTAVSQTVHPETANDTTPQPTQAATAPHIEAKTIVTDTVRSNRFLTTMAKEYYGKKKFWVYIYEENRAKLSDPDHIEANTVVVIPPAEKYGIKAGDKESEAEAERLATEIVNGKRR